MSFQESLMINKLLSPSFQNHQLGKVVSLLSSNSQSPYVGYKTTLPSQILFLNLFAEDRPHVSVTADIDGTVGCSNVEYSSALIAAVSRI